MKQMNRTVSTQRELESFAADLAGSIRGGEVIELIGDVGAGKTTFTKALAAALGISEPVQSPTFTISNRYQTDRGFELVHYDFYRLNDAGIMREELRESSHDENEVVVLEWGDIVRDVLPTDRLTIRFTVTSETGRRLEVVSGGQTSQRLLGVIA